MVKKNDTRKVFWEKGACSQTYFYILNREFGNNKNDEELASSPLAGGIYQQGYQCGMLWGASLAIGNESYRRNPILGLAIQQAITGTQKVLESFIKRTKSPDCIDISHCDLTTKYGFTKLMLKSVFTGFINSPCFKLAEKWTEEAINSAVLGLSVYQDNSHCDNLSCASEVVKSMGATNEQCAMVAGFAGGLGLSGNACGALSACIWMKTLQRVKKNEYKYAINDKELQNIINQFLQNTNYEMECRKITGQTFNTIEEHSDFIKCGGCKKLLELLKNF